MGCFVTDWPRNCPIMRHVLLLALDTSSPAGSVAVLRDEKVLGVVSTWTDEDYSSRMFRHVELASEGVFAGSRASLICLRWLRGRARLPGCGWDWRR